MHAVDVCVRLCVCLLVCVLVSVSVCTDDRIAMHCDSGQASLTINNTQSSDTGCYSIQLANIHGTDHMYSSVTIEGTSLLLSFALYAFSSYPYATAV